MRILLAANASYLPPRGGATRSNLAWLERLASRGHECRVVAAALVHGSEEAARQLRDEQIVVQPLGVDARDEADTGEAVRRGPLTIFSSAEAGRRRGLLRWQLREFRPDVVLVSSEDVAQPLLAEAERQAQARTFYLAHTPQFFPFGPESWYPNAQGTALVSRTAEVVVIGERMAAYVERHLGRRPEVAHPPIYGGGPWPDLARFDEGLITIVNPCAVKGLAIFRELARRLPEQRFGALPGWGTTSEDLRALEALPNVTLLPNRREFEDVLRATRVLLVPSLWYEGFGLVVMEAMLRGIPVVASDAGGLPEAKQGTGFVVPVRPIERYLDEYDERGLPRAVVPAQDLEPWVAALRGLLGDRGRYREESRLSREKATRFVARLDPDALESHLRRLAPAQTAIAGTGGSPAATPAVVPSASRAEPRLRILLAHNSPFFPAHGGGDRSNRLLLEALAARGHVCRVVARLARLGTREQETYQDELASRGVRVASAEAGVVGFRLGGVEVRVVAGSVPPRACFVRETDAFRPDVILASTDDPAQILLEGALEQPAARLVYLARATLALPFGPDGAFPSAAKAEALRQADAVVGVSEYVARYLRRWGGIDAVHLPISLMEPGPFPELGRFENELVTLVNPCAVKGISILLALADRMPDVSFAAVPTWGTTAADRDALRARANVRVLPPVDRIDDLLARTRVLLVPSLWAEARSRVVVEAMLRGIPVLASDVGGIREAKLGVPYLLPVRPIERYQPDLDERMVPVAEVPEQDVAPWQSTLRRVIGDRQHYAELARASREAALEYVSGLSVTPFEALLQALVRRPARRRGSRPPSSAAESSGALARLSPEKRQLLALRLNKQPARRAPAPDAWLPGLEMRPGARVRLFCLPHAGAGASAFRGWQQLLPAALSVCPVQLPGRESRANEPAFREMAGLVAALGPAIAPHTDVPYALFGHSMGAGVAFELARWLRRERCRLPFALAVSAARAPQRRSVPPAQGEPGGQEPIDALRDRGGIPQHVLDDPELMRLILPPLEADTALYRGYVYLEGEALPIPIRAYGGSDDRQVGREDLAAWRAQTSVAFALRIFPGGHFYLRTHEVSFLQALGPDLEQDAPRP